MFQRFVFAMVGGILLANLGCAGTKMPGFAAKSPKRTPAQQYAEQYVASNPNGPIFDSRTEDSSSTYSPPRRRQASSGGGGHSGCNH